MIKGNSIVVRIGGGFSNMEEYVTRRESEELERLRKLMSEGKTFPEVVRELLVKFKAEAPVINKIVKELQQQAIKQAMAKAKAERE